MDKPVAWTCVVLALLAFGGPRADAGRQSIEVHTVHVTIVEPSVSDTKTCQDAAPGPQPCLIELARSLPVGTFSTLAAAQTFAEAIAREGFWNPEDPRFFYPARTVRRVLVESAY